MSIDLVTRNALEISERERAAFLDERNQTRAELAAVRERMNALAVHCDKLEKNQLPAGAVCFVPTGEVRRRRKGDWYRWQDQAGDSLLEWTVTDDVSGEYPIYRRVEAQGEGAVNGYRDLLDTLAAIASKCGITEPGSEPKQLLSDNVKQHFDSIVAERDALRQEVERLKGEAEYQKSMSAWADELYKRASKEVDRLRSQLATYRRSHEAWKAVKKHKLDVKYSPDDNKWFSSQDPNTTWHAGPESEYFYDPIDAVLALAKELEGGK